MAEEYYRYHVFICTNQRKDGKSCCQDFKADDVRTYMKKRIKELGLHGKGDIRINSAGCMDRCSEGPVCVIYPEATWYTFIDNEDVDEIIEEHLLNHKKVERLQI